MPLCQRSGFPLIRWVFSQIIIHVSIQIDKTSERRNRLQVEGDRRLDARCRNEHDSFAAFAEPKKRAAIVWVFISVVHFATKRTEPVNMNAAATSFGAPIVCLTSYQWDIKFF